ncbi:MAG: helix-turn-helix domain-containing protein [Clostridia bacterium]|nr:helix-turn-helix domain-containing protein [Clostridia bacterium]
MFNILREIRLNKGLTQKKVAQQLGIEQQSYARLESTDIKSISIRRLNELSNIFQVPIETFIENTNKNKIPVLGTIPAGIPIEAIEEIIDYEEIPQTMAAKGEFFGLKVKGDSMSPRIQSGDVVIVQKQEDANSGDVCVVMVNGFDATLKQIKKDYNGITLVPFNKEYKEMFYSNKDIQELPIKIIGKVVELRGKF